MKNKTLYIHIPFCETICTYCDFPKVYKQEQNTERYLKQVIEQLKIRNENYMFAHVYIGGGTPSILTNDQIVFLFDQIKLNCQISPDAEITFECNPEHVNEEKLMTLKSVGVNRISLGVQTFQNRLLTIINRNHNATTALQAIKLISQHFDNYSIDLIFALPTQTIKELQNDIEIVKKLNPPHLSFYGLIIEENTILTSKVSKYDPENELDAEMFELVVNSFDNYYQYEISNFAAQEIYQSKFNLNYWLFGEYLGIGVGAHSYINNTRIATQRNLTKFLNGEVIDDCVSLTIKEQLEENLFLNLRTTKGINWNEIEKNYQINLEPWIDQLNLLCEKQLLETSDNHFKLTKKGLLFANDVFAAMII